MPFDSDSQFPFQGVIDSFDPKTQHVKQRATFQDHQLHGPMLVYDDDGHVHRKFDFFQGKLQGIGEFYRKGRIYALVPFEHGEIQGVATYYDQSGSKRMEASYQRGVLNGDMIFYAPLGHPVKTIPYQNGQKQGIAQSYYPTGTLLKTEPYLNDLLEGNATQYYENGKVCAWWFYVRGKLMEGPRFFDLKGREIVK